MEDVYQQRARSFGGVAGVYQRARPTYPMAAVRWMLEPAPGRQVLDLAAGTGKLTQVVVEAGYEVTAVEPAPEMLAELRAALPGVTALAGNAEQIPLADASCDAVLVAQAFHWFEPQSALDEIARVLRPGGALGLAWNLRDDSRPWVVMLSEILHGAQDTVSASRDLPEREPVEEHPAFHDVQRHGFANPIEFSLDRLLDWARSTSSVAVLEPGARDELLDEIRRLCATDPDLRGRDTIPMPFVTMCVRAVRAG